MGSTYMLDGYYIAGRTLNGLVDDSKAAAWIKMISYSVSIRMRRSDTAVEHSLPNSSRTWY